MLPQSSKRRTGVKSTIRSGGTSRPRHKPTFEQRRRKAQENNYLKYCIYGGVACLFITTIILFVSIIKNQTTTQPPFDAKQIENIVQAHKEPKGASPSPNILNPIHNQQQSYIISNPNKVKVTFRIYNNEACDESNPSSFIEITKESSDVSTDSRGNNCPLCYAFCDKKYQGPNDRIHLNERGQVRAIKIISNEIAAQLDLYSDCGLSQYHSSIFDFEGCVHIFDWPNTAGIKIKRNFLDFPQQLPPPIPASKLPPIQDHLTRDGISEESQALSKRTDIPSYLIAYSCESSEYCAFQAQANYYGYLTSGQHPTKSGFIRLLTAGEEDDLASYVPTFTAPRNLYSRRYSPYNKADVIVKWFQSKANLPKQDIIVVIDPDNWIIRDITHWIVKAKKGHAVGEAAWFHGSGLVTQLWKEVCLQNCDWELDMVGVPYIVHKDDLAVIAPYFKLYINIMKEREEKDSGFLNKYKGIQMGWGTEMFGYIFGAAHAGIKHEVVRGIQRRDVSSRPRDKTEELSIDMIHMGRAWWPHDYPLSKAYAHTEGKAWSRFGQQVWCKCNFTASDIIPWPMPETGVDFQSYHTLYLLYYGRQYFGELPKSKFRKPSKRYHEPYP